MTWMETKLFLREPVGAFFTLVFPLMMLFLFGSIYGNTPSEYFNGRGTVDISVPAYTAMIIATTGLVGLTITMAAYRENGVLRRLRTTPISPLVVLVAQVIVLFMMTVLGMLLLIIAGKLVYHLRFEGNALSVLAGFVLSSLSFFALGFVLAGLMPTARTAQVVGMVIPLTYVVSLLRGLWVGEPWKGHLTDVLVLVALLVAGVLISIKTFRWE
jgi:ABC-2 type transport system permease protein